MSSTKFLQYTMNDSGGTSSTDFIDYTGMSVNDTIELSEPGVYEIPANGTLDIIENDGPLALICYTVRVHPTSDQSVAEYGSLSVMDYYDVTEPYVLEIPSTAHFQIEASEGAQHFDIS